MKYKERTPESIRAELASMTPEKAKRLAEFLQAWMANEHNGRDFFSCLDNDLPPVRQCKLMLVHAYDWFAYGN